MEAQENNGFPFGKFLIGQQTKWKWEHFAFNLREHIQVQGFFVYAIHNRRGEVTRLMQNWGFISSTNSLYLERDLENWHNSWKIEQTFWNTRRSCSSVRLLSFLYILCTTLSVFFISKNPTPNFTSTKFDNNWP